MRNRSASFVVRVVKGGCLGYGKGRVSLERAMEEGKDPMWCQGLLLLY